MRASIQRQRPRQQLSCPTLLLFAFFFGIMVTKQRKEESFRPFRSSYVKHECHLTADWIFWALRVKKLCKSKFEPFMHSRQRDRQIIPLHCKLNKYAEQICLNDYHIPAQPYGQTMATSAGRGIYGRPRANIPQWNLCAFSLNWDNCDNDMDKDQ